MQREEKQLDAALEALIQRVTDLKNNITAFLFKLEHEYESLSWPSVLDSFALLSGQVNTLNKLLKNDRTPALRNLVLLPLTLHRDRDEQLEHLTEGRVIAFSHEVVPDYLRTKPEPEVEEKNSQLAVRANQLSVDNVQKQINMLTKIVNTIIESINSKREEWESEMNQKSTQPSTSSQADTHTLIAAVTFGKGLKPLRRSDSAGSTPTTATEQRPTQPQHHQAPQAGSVHINKAPSTIKTNIKAASNTHPYSRN